MNIDIIYHGPNEDIPDINIRERESIHFLYHSLMISNAINLVELHMINNCFLNVFFENHYFEQMLLLPKFVFHIMNFTILQRSVEKILFSWTFNMDLSNVTLKFLQLRNLFFRFFFLKWWIVPTLLMWFIREDISKKRYGKAL